MRLVEKRQRTGQVAGELTFRRADGSTFPAEFTSSILPSGSSAPLAIVIFRDVAEERAVVSAPEESRIRLAFALEASDLGSWDWVVKESVVTVNRRCMHILGIPMADEEAVYSIAHWTGAIHPDDAPRVIAATEGLTRGRFERFDLEYRIAAGDGSWNFVRVRAATIVRNPDGIRDSRDGQGPSLDQAVHRGARHAEPGRHFTNRQQPTQVVTHHQCTKRRRNRWKRCQRMRSRATFDPNQGVAGSNPVSPANTCPVISGESRGFFSGAPRFPHHECTKPSRDARRRTSRSPRRDVGRGPGARSPGGACARWTRSPVVAAFGSCATRP